MTKTYLLLGSKVNPKFPNPETLKTLKQTQTVKGPEVQNLMADERGAMLSSRLGDAQKWRVFAAWGFEGV